MGAKDTHPEEKAAWVRLGGNIRYAGSGWAIPGKSEMANRKRRQTTLRQVPVTRSEAAISMKSKQIHAGVRSPTWVPGRGGNTKIRRDQKRKQASWKHRSKRAQLQPEEAEKADSHQDHSLGSSSPLGPHAVWTLNWLKPPPNKSFGSPELWALQDYTWTSGETGVQTKS